MGASVKKSSKNLIVIFKKLLDKGRDAGKNELYGTLIVYMCEFK